MEDSRIPEAEQLISTGEKTKPRTCFDCGFFTIEGRELNEWDRSQLYSYERNNRGNLYWLSGPMPSHAEKAECHKGIWKYNPDLGFSMEDFVLEIAQSRDDCSDFAEYEKGYTPRELRNRIEAKNHSERLEMILTKIAEKQERLPSNGEQRESISPSLQNVFAVKGKMVHIRFAGQEVGIFENSKGMQYLAYLVNHPGQKYATASQLYSAVFGVDPNRKTYTPNSYNELSAGFRQIEYLPEERNSDLQSLKACNDELNDINTKLDALSSDAFSSPDERDQLLERKEQLLQIVRMIRGDKSRRAELDPETAKLINAIRHAVFRAIENIEKAEAGAGKDLAEHLTTALKPFSFPLSYNPQPPIPWNE